MKLKVVSLNVWNGGVLMPALLDFLRTTQADILLLQEVNNSTDSQYADMYRTFQTLQQQLDYGYSEFSPVYTRDLEVGLIPEGLATFSRFPITKLNIYPLNDVVPEPSYTDAPENYPRIPCLLQRAEITTPAGIVTTANVHGVWDLDGDNPSAARQLMVQRMLAQAEGAPHFIMAGDTNAKPTNPAMQTLEATLNMAIKPYVATTFNMQRKTNPGYASAAVDHMYVSPDVQLLDAECPTVDISDHLPLVATLEI